MTKLRIGVIGAGSIAAAHLDAYAAHPDVELIAVADINLDRARAVADRYGAARAYDDAHDLLAADDIDGVSICTWNDTHAVWATAAIEAGKHRSEEHTSELQSRGHLVCRLLLEKKKNGA